ncbi:hypothetical protein [Peptostreptococcus equinus]|uniref:Uncharacterized protein n=1 Tax=Peptostreptococcus equinus TaxID=3003601 RepID=A0ABY7JNB5_9FIRM|nr:hypothetical protein [Peptostreptococcus sp. CBA3647]WAW14832.1 hypothetical protein O0R46_09645 [Peptostreptococcus sp. CBA3647]
MKKRFKKVTSVFMALVLLASSLPANALAADSVTPTGVSTDKKLLQQML